MIIRLTLDWKCHQYKKAVVQFDLVWIKQAKYCCEYYNPVKRNCWARANLTLALYFLSPYDINVEY